MLYHIWRHIEYCSMSQSLRYVSYSEETSGKMQDRICARHGLLAVCNPVSRGTHTKSMWLSYGALVWKISHTPDTFVTCEDSSTRRKNCHLSHVICHVSFVTCHMSHVTCHMSHVMCHLSHVTFYRSPVTWVQVMKLPESHYGDNREAMLDTFSKRLIKI